MFLSHHRKVSLLPTCARACVFGISWMDFNINDEAPSIGQINITYDPIEANQQQEIKMYVADDQDQIRLTDGVQCNISGDLVNATGNPGYPWDGVYTCLYTPTSGGYYTVNVTAVDQGGKSRIRSSGFTVIGDLHSDRSEHNKRDRAGNNINTVRGRSG